MADHDDRTPNIPGQRQQPPATNSQDPSSPLQPAPSLQKKEPRLAAVRGWWQDAWDDGGFLHNRWEDLRQAPALGWHSMA
ncbi:hypothetical protein ACFWDF_32420, partial [Streptomyces diastaticus]